MGKRTDKPRIHNVWEVRIGSRHDGRPINQIARRTYLIESRVKNGIATIKRKALQLATEDGILSPIVLSVDRMHRD